MFTMKDVCKQVNMPYETLKFYCNKGLVPNVKRDNNNYRIFDENDVAWIKSLICLKNCGMSIQEMKEYLDFCLDGPSTIPQRKIILDKKREELLGKVSVLQKSIDYIDWKQGFYDEPVEGGVEITDERWLELIDGQAAGMLITEDEQGSPVLTEYVNSVPVPTYEQRVQQSIRERYSVDDELAILRQRDTKPDEFAAYYEYAEQCKAQAKKQMQL